MGKDSSATCPSVYFTEHCAPYTMNSALLFSLHTLHFTAVECRVCCRKRNEDFIKGGQGISFLRIIPSLNFFFQRMASGRDALQQDEN